MKITRLLTIIFSMMILVGAGHGIGPLIIFELGFYALLTGEVEFNLVGRYADRLPAAAMIALVGQAILIVNFFFEKNVKAYLSILGTLIILVAIYVLIQDVMTQDATFFNLDFFSLVFSIPAIVTGLRLLIFDIRELSAKKNVG